MAQIAVSHLTFAYEGSYNNIFEDVSFRIDTDWKLGFIGRNGRGKTTFLNLLQGIFGAKESADEILAENEYPVVSPDQFGKVLLKLLRTVYEGRGIAAFAENMYGLWEMLPDGVKHDEPLIQLCFADDRLSATGDEDGTRRIYEELFRFYDGRDTTFPIMRS